MGDGILENNNLELVLNGLNCANCARKIEERVGNLEGVKESNLNFTTLTLKVKLHKSYEEEKAFKDINDIVIGLEPHVVVEKKSKANQEDKKVSFKVEPMLIIGAIIYLVAVLGSFSDTVSLVLYVASYILIGGEVVLAAIKNIAKGEVFDENFLMTVATIGAFAIKEFPEAVAVMLFYQIGETIQGYAVNKSRTSISSLMDIRADYANLLRNGKEEKVNPEIININDVIIIKPGERVPLDGIVIEGESYVDTSALTGESVPRKVTAGNEILSGGINTNGVIKVQVTKEIGRASCRERV